MQCAYEDENCHLFILSETVSDQMGSFRHGIHIGWWVPLCSLSSSSCLVFDSHKKKTVMCKRFTKREIQDREIYEIYMHGHQGGRTRQVSTTLHESKRLKVYMTMICHS